MSRGYKIDVHGFVRFAGSMQEAHLAKKELLENQGLPHRTRGDFVSELELPESKKDFITFLNQVAAWSDPSSGST